MHPVTTTRISANGLDFAVDVAGDGDTVALLLHGFPEARQAWREQLPFLAGLGFKAAAPDLRGYGETSRPAGKAAYRLDRLIEDVGALFDALGARRRLLIGHDWGGVIAWQAAISGRVPLDGLVILNAPHPAVFARVLHGGWRQRLRSWYVLFFLLPWLPEYYLARAGGRGLEVLRRQSPGFPPDLLTLYRRNITAPGAATAMVNYYRANALDIPVPEPGDRLRVPTLMLWGEGDEALDLALTQGNETWVERFTLQRYPGVSHWILEEAPARVNADIAAWAAGHGLIPAPPGDAGASLGGAESR